MRGKVLLACVLLFLIAATDTNGQSTDGSRNRARNRGRARDRSGPVQAINAWPVGRMGDGPLRVERSTRRPWLWTRTASATRRPTNYIRRLVDDESTRLSERTRRPIRRTRRPYRPTTARPLISHPPSTSHVYNHYPHYNPAATTIQGRRSIIRHPTASLLSDRGPESVSGRDFEPTTLDLTQTGRIPTESTRRRYPL